MQTKKTEIRDAILDGARQLFRERGYNASTITRIAERAGVSPANIYVYFSSKLEILFALYDPWLRERLEKLERDVAPIAEPEARLRFILRTLWADIPAEDNCFANNLMQALSSASAEEGYSRDLLVWAEDKLSELIAGSLPAERQFLVRNASVAHILFMAFDGFAMNRNLMGPSRRMEDMVELMLAMLLGRAEAAPIEIAEPPDRDGDAQPDTAAAR